MNTTIQTRIDAKLKREAKQTLAELGLDLSTGIKLFLTQVVHTQSIPFMIKSADDLTESVKLEIIDEVKQAKNNAKRYKDVKEAHREVLKK